MYMMRFLNALEVLEKVLIILNVLRGVVMDMLMPEVREDNYTA